MGNKIYLFYKNILINNHNTCSMGTFFRREDPMKLKIFTFIKIIFNIYFLGKKKNFLFINTSIIKYPFGKIKQFLRDNSIIFIKDLIEINVCDLDVELNFYICEEAYTN